jgi:GNAT superfamily N-acetyltransferase
VEVIQITAEETYLLRQEVLRTGLPIETCHFKGDFNQTTFHLSVQLAGVTRAIASFYNALHENLPAQRPFQLRGMATSLEFRGQGLGATLLQAAIPRLTAQRCDLLWCNARERAAKFYLRNGFSIRGQLFEIEGVGPHFLMFKNI